MFSEFGTIGVMVLVAFVFSQQAAGKFPASNLHMTNLLPVLTLVCDNRSSDLDDEYALPSICQLEKRLLAPYPQ